MPEDRLFHPRLKNSSKVSSLLYLERCVWEDMLLGADDYGVLPNRPARLRGDNLAFLNRETDETIRAAIAAVVAAELVLPFEHQGQPYLCDPRWQDFQKIERPRRTYYPIPEPAALGRCTPATIVLFASHHPAASSFSFPELFRNARRELSKSAGGRSQKHCRLTANGKRLTANGKTEEGSGEESSRGVVVAGFEWFWSTWPKDRRKAKGQAVAEWQRLKPSPDLERQIIAAVDVQKGWPDWRKEGGRYIPYPHRWLKGRRWEDEGGRGGQSQDALVAGLEKFVRGGSPA